MKGELLVLGLALAGLVLFVWLHIANELPEDFLTKHKRKSDGRLRDNRETRSW
jgi:hypothetical protein